MVLLPEEQVDIARREELPAILIHETAHVKACDLLWNGVLHALSMLFWFHPLVWRIRFAHVDACDAVADSFAAHHVGDVTHYIRTLARLAVQMHHPAPGAALAMAQASNVRQRIEALQRKLFHAGLPRGRMLCAVALGAITVALLGGVALTRATAEPQVGVSSSDDPKTEVARPKTTEATSEQDRLVIHATDAETGEPLEGVEIRFFSRLERELYEPRVETNAKGVASVPFESGRQINYLRITCTKSGYVPLRRDWQTNRKRVQLPEEVCLEFQHGQQVGGIVQNKQRQPIEEAKVEIMMPVGWPKPRGHVFIAATRTTDADGRWSWNGAPKDLGPLQAGGEVSPLSGRIAMKATHPIYQTDVFDVTAGRNGSNTLKDGLPVAGRVLTLDGGPIAGATVRVSKDGSSMVQAEAKTDAQGRFRFTNCKPGSAVVIVQAEDYRPEVRGIVIGSHESVDDIQLAPGHTMRVRVVDSDGEPIKDADFVVGTWRGYKTLQVRLVTDETGRVEWTSAPEDTVQCGVVRWGYMSVSMPLVASNEEHVITLPPPVVISGKVTNAKTGEPIPAFEVGWSSTKVDELVRRPGGVIDKRFWQEAGISYRHGVYRITFEYPYDGEYRICVVAPGYQPASSRPFQIDEGSVTLDFALRPGQGRSAPSEAIVYSRQTAEDATKRNRLVVHATAKDTGKPLGGVKIQFEGSLDRWGFEREVETNDEGMASIEWDAGAEFGRLSASCLKSGFVPIHCRWGYSQGKSNLPEDVHLRFQAGKWIGGIVQDQDGRPIKGATVKVRKIVDLPKPAYYWHNVAELKTDAEGRWRWKGVPSDLSHFGIDIFHPSYVERLHQLTAGTETPYVIKRGRRVTGRVLTSDGTPIEGATALFGYDRSMAGARKVSTNSEGRFEVENCKPGESLATVQAEGYSPTQREIVVGEHEDLGEFRLTKGHTLRVRIVDSRGDPPKSAYLKVESWKGHGALAYFAYAHEEGRVLWQSAPEDTVLCTIRGAGCSELTNYPLQASDEEHVVTLAPELIITGNVTDAKTGQPIPSSVICPGFDRSPNGMFWVWNGENHYKGGAYQWNPRGQIAGGPSVAS